jgi:hypothetical protein
MSPWRRRGAAERRGSAESLCVGSALCGASAVKKEFFESSPLVFNSYPFTFRVVNLR